MGFFFGSYVEAIGFNEALVQLLMKCVRSVIYRIKVNRELTDVIIPERDLRQGDPLSTYLFFLYVLRASHLFYITQRLII